MKHKVFSVFDSAVGAYLPPFFAPSVGAAARSFMAACAQSDHQFSMYAADYTLFEIGEFDDQDGQLDALTAFVNHGTALEHKVRWSENYAAYVAIQQAKAEEEAEEFQAEARPLAEAFALKEASK